jgi:hypothetical protein
MQSLGAALPDQKVETVLIPVQRLELVYAERDWPFALERRPQIDQHFAELRRSNPTLWNGRVLMLCEHAIRGGVFYGTYFQTDFASMLAWRDWGFPDSQVKNCFAMGALRGADGRFVLGIMAAHTANAGWTYFPAGVPDPSDVDGARVDLTKGLMREMTEETGLAPAEFEPERGWTTVLAGPRVAQIKLLRVQATAAALRARILAHLAREPEPELADVRLVGNPADFDPTMPPYVTAFLRHVWGTGRV